MTKTLAKSGEFSLPDFRKMNTLQPKELLRLVDEFRAANPASELPDELTRVMESVIKGRWSRTYDQRYRAHQFYFQALLELEKAVALYREAWAHSEDLRLLTETIHKSETLMGAMVSEMQKILSDAEGLATAFSRLNKGKQEGKARDIAEKVSFKLSQLKKADEVVKAAIDKTFVKSTAPSFAKWEHDPETGAPRIVWEEFDGSTIEEGQAAWSRVARETRNRITAVLRALWQGTRTLDYKPSAVLEWMERISRETALPSSAAPALPPLRKEKGRSPAKSSDPGIDEQLYELWIEAINKIKTYEQKTK